MNHELVSDIVSANLAFACLCIVQLVEYHVGLTFMTGGLSYIGSL